MSIRELPPRPDLEHLKKQAKELLHKLEQREPEALRRAAGVRVEFDPAAPQLSDAQRVLALEHGFESWPKLKAHVASAAENAADALAAAINANDAALVRTVLARHPELKARIDEPLPGLSFDAPAMIGAVHRNNREMVEALLDAGANINARTKWWAGGFGVLDVSSQELTPYLIERGAYVDIHAAARLGRLDRVKELSQGDPALVHARGGDGQLPLHFAATVEIAEYLIAHGAKIDARDIDHESTAAQYAVSIRPRRPDVARLLVAHGAETDILMSAALGDVELVRRHLDANPEAVWTKVSEEDFPKRNPDAGGCIYIFGFGWNKTPHMLAGEGGHAEALRLLMERSPLELQLSQALAIGDEAAAELMAGHPGAISTLSPRTRGAMVSAAMQNNTRGVERMVSAGWPVDVRGDKDRTALHWAGWHGNSEMARALLAAGAPLEVREAEYGGTPLGWAIHGSKNGWHAQTGDYVGTVEALLAAGAKAPALSDVLTVSAAVREVLRRHADRSANKEG